MGRELHSRLLGHGNHVFQKSLQAPPQFFMRNRRQNAGWCVAVIDHVPDRAIRNGHVFGGTVHAQSDCMAASQRGSYAAADTGKTEVVPEYWNTGFAETANNGLHVFDLLRALRTVEQNIVPMRGIEVLDRG